MKNKKWISPGMFILVLMGLIIWTSCRKERTEGPSVPNNLKKPVASGSLATPTNLNEIEEQLQWIARGYPIIIQNAVYNGYLSGYLIPKDYYQDIHDNIEPFMMSNAGLDVELTVFDEVNQRFSGNNYNRDYFYGFLFDNCNFKTGLRIVDTPRVGKPLVVTYESPNGYENIYGYYLDSLGNTDSVLLTSNNYEDYYVWQVFADSDCKLMSRGQEGCNFNGICEPIQGEHPGNCADCVPPIPAEKELRVVWVRINEDQQAFDEAWGQGKYELGWDWCIGNGTTVVAKHYSTSNLDYDVYDKWKRKELKICRKNCKGTPTQKQYQNNTDGILSHYFLPGSHDVYLRFWEDDRYGSGCSSKPKDAMGNDLNYDMKARVKGGTFHQGNNGAGDGMLVVRAGSTNWVPEVINGTNFMVQEVQSPGLGEITVKLAYKP